MRARLFETVGEAIPRANRPEAVKSMAAAAASEMDRASADAFTKLMTAGNTGAAHAFLNAEARKARGQSVQEASAELAERTQRYGEAKSGFDRLTQEIEELRAKGETEDPINKKLAEQAELEKAMHEMRERNADDLQILDEEAGKTEEVIAPRQEYLNLLKQQELVMQNLDQLAAPGRDGHDGRSARRTGGRARAADSNPGSGGGTAAPA